jgi:hypothetical protein
MIHANFPPPRCEDCKHSVSVSVSENSSPSLRCNLYVKSVDVTDGTIILMEAREAREALPLNMCGPDGVLFDKRHTWDVSSMVWDTLVFLFEVFIPLTIYVTICTFAAKLVISAICLILYNIWL